MQRATDHLNNRLHLRSRRDLACFLSDGRDSSTAEREGSTIAKAVTTHTDPHGQLGHELFCSSRGSLHAMLSVHRRLSRGGSFLLERSLQLKELGGDVSTPVEKPRGTAWCIADIGKCDDLLLRLTGAEMW